MASTSSDSRYANAAYENAVSHTYDALGNVDNSETDTKKVNVLSRSTSYLLTTGQSSVPPKSYMVKMTDNIQLLAYRVLQDPTRWWVIANGNPHIRYPMDLAMGDTIYLPE
jgi:hypothetical protein